jgi:hypothetical protein
MKVVASYERMKSNKFHEILLPRGIISAFPRYKNAYQFLNTLSYKPFTDLQVIIILELPKVPEEDDGSGLWPWLKYFKCRTKEELSMLAKQHEEVARVVQQYQRTSLFSVFGGPYSSTRTLCVSAGAVSSMPAGDRAALLPLRLE